jgi:transcriptional regulator with XRE-family HTH domain
MMLTLPERVQELVKLHGSLRAVARKTGVDVAYLKRLRDGEKQNPSDDTLKKLGIEKRILYVLR